MSISKRKLRAIKGLMVSGIIDEDDSEGYEDYCAVLDDFVETYPSMEEGLIKTSSKKDYEAFAAVLSDLRELLGRIKAAEAKLNCGRLIEELENKNYSAAGEKLPSLLSEISALSISIQIARSETAESGEDSEELESDTEDEDERPKKTILAVDDVSILLHRLKSILQSDYKFVALTSGEAALRFIEKNTPDLFILDIEMPGMNGYELAKRLKESGQNAPIIFLTGNASAEYVRKALEAGAVDFIVKPVNKQLVLEKIAKYLD